MSRKVRKVSCFLEDTELVSHLLALALSSRPLDELVVELIRRDHNGRVLADLLSTTVLNPVRRCQKDFVDVLCCGDVSELVYAYFPLDLNGRRRR
eukprot:9251480-Pyramimonas_sp.AAC.1